MLMIMHFLFVKKLVNLVTIVIINNSDEDRIINLEGWKIGILNGKFTNFIQTRLFSLVMGF